QGGLARRRTLAPVSDAPHLIQPEARRARDAVRGGVVCGWMPFPGRSRGERGQQIERSCSHELLTRGGHRDWEACGTERAYPLHGPGVEHRGYARNGVVRGLLIARATLAVERGVAEHLERVRSGRDVHHAVVLRVYEPWEGRAAVRPGPGEDPAIRVVDHVGRVRRIALVVRAGQRVLGAWVRAVAPVLRGLGGVGAELRIGRGLLVADDQ